MAMERHVLVGVHLDDRAKEAGGVQKLLSEYGCSIRTRVGFHDVSEDYCANTGVIVLDTIGDEAPVDEMIEKLNAIEGVEARKIVFEE